MKVEGWRGFHYHMALCVAAYGFLASEGNLKPDPTKVVELVDGAVRGLRLRVTPAGTRSWSHQYPGSWKDASF